MIAISKSLAPFYRSTSIFISIIIPEAFKLIVLTFFVLLSSYLRHSSRRRYNSMIDLKSSRFIFRRTQITDSKEFPECSICLSEFCAGEKCRKLQCNHIFHRNCLDTWLGRGGRPTCPLCRGSVVPEEVEWEYNAMQKENLMEYCFEKELALMLLAAADGRSCGGL